MKAKAKPQLAVLRLFSAAVKQQEIDERIELDDQRVLATLDKMVKQRRDSIQQFEAAERQELADKEQAEIDVIQEFLPAQLSAEELNGMIAAAIESSGAESMKDMGKVMGILKPQLQGRADMGEVSKQIKASLG